MKRIGIVILSLIVALSTAQAREAPATIITSTGASITNTVPFPVEQYGNAQAAVIQCDAAAYYLAVTSTAGAVTSSTGLKVAADEKWPIAITKTHPYLAIISVSGTVNCKVTLVF